ncbi:MAG: radical SAM protein [Planctomycetes bacterium]|nr:radical SAM protein [Planctomycetota bacterium]
MPPTNHAVCETCRKHVPARHEIRQGSVYLCKDCPDCGTTESLITQHAAAWQRKRDLFRYDPAVEPTCDLRCTTCARQPEHHPRMVFVDVTNRCNMNCPICIANIPAMGFTFHPPLDYFGRVFDGLARMTPKPSVHLFGGEPTMREDLFEIIRMGQAKGLNMGIETNGLRLADEDYCRRLCETKVRVLMACDGLDPEIYTRLRKAPNALAKKLEALKNLKKHSLRPQTIMCCVARKVNDQHMRGLIDFCHENRSFIRCLHLIPLTESWKKGEVEVEAHTSIEDAEQIIQEAFPDEQVAFLPMGFSRHINRALRFFGGVQMTFAEVHPNCESVTILWSDGTRFRPLSSYMKVPLFDFCEEFVKRLEAIGPRLDRLDAAKGFSRLRGRLLVFRKFLGLVKKSFRWRMILKGNPALALLRVLGGAMMGKSLKTQLTRHCKVTNALDMIVLSFEEYHSIDGARLSLCKGEFAYEDPDDGVVKTIPICVWSQFRDTIERRIAAKVGDALKTKAAGSRPEALAITAGG